MAADRDEPEFPSNPFKALLGGGRPLVGIWSMLNSTNAVEGLSSSGFDWILLDGEHTPMSLADMISHLRALKGSPLVPIVRIVWNDLALMKQHLDAGATTLMLPYIQTADEAEQAARSMRYPPRGVRGVAVIHRASRYGSLAGYAARADETLCLIVQIETRAALDRLEEIAAVDGVDALFLGPGDLAASIGLIGRPDHPDVTALIEEALARACRAGKPVGVLAPNADLAERHIRSGFDFVSVANDAAVLFRTAEQLAGRFRSIAETRRTA